MKKIAPFLIIFVTVFILYHPVLTTYFSQDDFFHFKISQTDGSLKGFINLFGFHPFEERSIAFYRPISRELLFNLYYSIFGLNHLPFRVLSLIIHLINIFLVFSLMQKLFNKRGLSFFVAFFFGITAANVALLYYLAGGIQTLFATTFILSSLILFIDYLKTSYLKIKIISFILFLLGLGSHELAVIIPVLLTGIIFIYYATRKALREIWKLWPFFITTFVYLYFDVTKIGFSSTESQYQVVSNLKTTINSLIWYYSWALGLPQMLIDFVLPGLKLNPTLMRYWGNYFIIIFPTFLITFIILVTTIIYLLLKRKHTFLDKKFWFLFFWFPIGILPVVFLPLHKSTHYLTPVLAAFWGMIGFIIFNFYKHLAKTNSKLAGGIVLILIAALFSLSATSTFLGNQTFWAATRGKLAKKMIDDVKRTYPTLPKSATVYFKNDPQYPFLTQEWGGTSKQASFILNGADALQLLYNDLTLKVYYEDLSDTPYDTPDKLFTVVARIQ